MIDLKHQRAIEKLEALKHTHCTLRMDPRVQEPNYLYSLLGAYGFTFNGQDWQPFISNPLAEYECQM